MISDLRTLLGSETANPWGLSGPRGSLHRRLEKSWRNLERRSGCRIQSSRASSRAAICRSSLTATGAADRIGRSGPTPRASTAADSGPRTSRTPDDAQRVARSCGARATGPSRAPSTSSRNRQPASSRPSCATHRARSARSATAGEGSSRWPRRTRACSPASSATRASSAARSRTTTAWQNASFASSAPRVQSRPSQRRPRSSSSTTSAPSG
jgi:hypothetical protein